MAMLVGADKKRHAFKIECMIRPHWQSIEATEVGGDTYYREDVYGELDHSFMDMWSQMLRRLEKTLSNKYMSDKDFGRFREMQAVGYIDYNRDRDDYDIVIDGRPYTWEQLKVNLAPCEGFKIKIEIADMSDELE